MTKTYEILRYLTDDEVEHALDFTYTTNPVGLRSNGSYCFLGNALSTPSKIIHAPGAITVYNILKGRGRVEPRQYHTIRRLAYEFIRDNDANHFDDEGLREIVSASRA